MDVTLEEVGLLIAYHDDMADHALACKQNQTRIARTEPLHTFGERQTKEDWLNAAAESEEVRKYHRTRARQWRKYAESLVSEESSDEHSEN